MAKKNRASLLKRQREADKRQRQAKRAEKAAVKRERRMEKKLAGSPIVPGEHAQDNAALDDVSTAGADVDQDASVAGPGANEYGTSASEPG